MSWPSCLPRAARPAVPAGGSGGRFSCIIGVAKWSSIVMIFMTLPRTTVVLRSEPQKAVSCQLRA